MVLNENINSTINEVPLHRAESLRNCKYIDGIRIKANELNIDPSNIIHIGGTAQYYYMRRNILEFLHQKYSKAESNVNIAKLASFYSNIFFRGTHDIDILLKNRSDFSRIIQELKIDKKYEAEFLGRDASHQFESKAKYALGIKRQPASLYKNSTSSTYTTPKNIDEFEVDVYYFERSKKTLKTNETDESSLIYFNDRFLGGLTKDTFKIILDKPILLDLEDGLGQVCVPTLLDCFIFKTDIVSHSLSGLRPKDCVDLLFMISAMSPDQMEKSIEFIALSSDARKKFSEIKKVISTAPDILRVYSQKIGYSIIDITKDSIVNFKKISQYENDIKRFSK